MFFVLQNTKKATYGLGNKLTLTRNKDYVIFDEGVAIDDARIKIDNIHWHVPHYTPPTPQQCISFEQILSKPPTELRHIERSVFAKEVDNRNL